MVEYNAYEFYEGSEDWMGFELNYECHVNGRERGRSGFGGLFMYNVTPDVVRVYTYNGDEEVYLMDWNETIDGKSMDYDNEDLSYFSDDFVQNLLYACLESDVW